MRLKDSTSETQLPMSSDISALVSGFDDLVESGIRGRDEEKYHTISDGYRSEDDEGEHPGRDTGVDVSDAISDDPSKNVDHAIYG